MATRSVVVLGKGSLAIGIAEWFRGSPEWEVSSIVPVVPEPQWTGSLIEWAEERGVPYVESGDWADLAAAGGGPIADLAFSVFYDRILPTGFIDRFDRALNLHNGPLPLYRGVSPINWALKNEESSHGVTIHEITPGVDDGPIVAQVRYSIYPDQDEVEDVYRRALAYGWTLFEQTMPLLDRIEPTPQDGRRATHYRRADDVLLGERRSFRRDLSLDYAPSSPA